MKVLVLCEDCAHPATLTQKGLDGLQSDSFEFTYISDPTEWSPDRMDGYPLVAFSKANQVSADDSSAWATEETGSAFIDYAARGGGILFLHSGTALYKELPSFCALMGGVFVSHPPQCQVTVEPVADHPLGVGGESFSMTDEHYMMEMFDESVGFFLHTRSEHGVQPAGWIRREGKGRVAVLTPSHHPEGWTHPGYQPILRNCLEWCAGEDTQRR